MAEQVTALPPFSFRIIDGSTAEVVQDLANGFFGQWSVVRVPKNRIRVQCTATSAGTKVEVDAQGDRAATSRASNLIRVLTAGERDDATVYRYRLIPPGPCTIVQSWAGTGYPLYVDPAPDAPRGRAVGPSGKLVALQQTGRWVRVRAGEGDDTEEGWIEADQLVPDQAVHRQVAPAT